MTRLVVMHITGYEIFVQDDIGGLVKERFKAVDEPYIVPCAPCTPVADLDAVTIMRGDLIRQRINNKSHLAIPFAAHLDDFVEIGRVDF